MSDKKEEKVASDKNLVEKSNEELQQEANDCEATVKTKKDSIASMVKYVEYHQEIDPLVKGFGDGMNPLKQDKGFGRCNVV